MVPIRQYRTFWEFVQLRIPEIKTVKVVSAEVQMQNFISEVQTDDVTADRSYPLFRNRSFIR